MFGPVRSGIAQHEERAELGQGLDSGLALHLLRLIEDEDRPVGSNHIDRFARLEIIQRVINPAVILAAGVERLDVHHHHIQPGIGRKALQLVKPLRVVDEEARLLAVGLGEVLCRDRQRFGYAFADGDAGHDDDELRPAIAAVQLEHRLDVAIGFARAGLHLDIEMKLADRRHILEIGCWCGHRLALGVTSDEAV